MPLFYEIQCIGYHISRKEGRAPYSVSTHLLYAVRKLRYCKIFDLQDIMVVKLGFPRRPIEGARDERDMYGGQQYVSLLDLEVKKLL